MGTDAPPTTRKLLVSAATNWLAFAATLLVSFFLTPYLIRKLGDGQYGIWVFVESILAYFTLFDLGLAACMVRFVARFRARQEQDELNRLASSCLAVFLALGWIVFAVGEILSPMLVPSVNGAGMARSEVLSFLMLMIGNLALTLPLSLFPATLDGLGKFTTKSAVTVSFLALRTTASIILMENAPSLLGLGIILTIGNVAEHAVLVGFTFFYMPGLRFKRSLIDRETLRMVRGYSANAFLALIAGRLSVQSAALLIGIFLSAPEITWFAIALRLVEFAKGLLRAGTSVLTPAVSSLESTGDLARVGQVYIKATRCVLALMIPVNIGLILFGAAFIRIWISQERAERSYPVLVILSMPLLLSVSQSVASRMLYGTGKLRYFARATLVEGCSIVGLSALFVHRFGIVGVAVATVIPHALSCAFVIYYTCRTLHISIRDYISKAWMKPLGAGILLAGFWLLFDWPRGSWMELGLSIGCGMAIYTMTIGILEFPRILWPRFRLKPLISAGS